MHIMCSGLLLDFWGLLGPPKGLILAPKGPAGGPDFRRSQGGPGGPDLVPTAAGWSTWVELMVTTHFGLVSDLFRPPGGSIMACFGTKCPYWAKLVPLAAMKRPNINP